MEKVGEDKFAIHSTYVLSGTKRPMRAENLLASAANKCLRDSAALSIEPLELWGVTPVVASVKGELTLVNESELLKWVRAMPDPMFNPNQEIYVFELAPGFTPLALKAIEYVFEARATKKKAAQEKMIKGLRDDRELLSEVRQIWALGIRGGKLAALDIARIFSLSSAVAHNRFHAVVKKPKSKPEVKQNATEGEIDLPANTLSAEDSESNYVQAVETVLSDLGSVIPEQQQAVDAILERISGAKLEGGRPIDVAELRAYVKAYFDEQIILAIEVSADPSHNWSPEQ